MTLFKNKYRIESARLKNWDYRNGGAYFITICTKDCQCFFGECRDGNMNLSDAGTIAEQYWAEIPNHFQQVQLGAYIVMPNHVHGILILDGTLKLQHGMTTNHPNEIKNQSMSKISPEPGSVSTIIRSYKSECTKYIRNNIDSYFSWQSRFHDHIIRNQDEYIRIENYIVNNPKNWDEDKFFDRKSHHI